jgi:hypothetical protein
MKRGPLKMEFEYDEENFDGELTDERVKDTVQDTVLSHPEMVYGSIDVVEDPAPEQGLSQEALAELEAATPEERDLCSLDIGDIFSLDQNSGEFYVLVDVEMLGEHRDNVWSYANAATGEFEGLLRDGACPEHYAETVYYYTHHNALVEG